MKSAKTGKTKIHILRQFWNLEYPGKKVIIFVFPVLGFFIVWNSKLPSITAKLPNKLKIAVQKSCFVPNTGADLHKETLNVLT